MRVYKYGEPPIQFLLHVLEGYVSELRVFCADFSYIDQEINFEGAKVEVIIS